MLVINSAMSILMFGTRYGPDNTCAVLRAAATPRFRHHLETEATRRLKELNPSIQCIALQPDAPFHGIEGAKHMASAIVPKIYDPTLADRRSAAF